MVASGEVAEIKDDAAYAACVCILLHMAVGIQDQPVIIRYACFQQPFLRIFKRCFLDIKSQYLPLGSRQAAEKFCVVPVAHGGVDTQIARLYLRRDKMAAPLCNLIYGLIPPLFLFIITQNVCP